MAMTRRSFLALGSVAALLPLDFRFPAGSQASDCGCVILDLEQNCSLPESLKGYQGCLTDLGFRSVTVTTETLPNFLAQTRQVVVPAAASTDVALARHLVAVLENGGSVLWESGLAFADHAVWNAQQRLLQSHLDLMIQPPVRLWSAAGRHRSLPYVDYLWPLTTKVRDFSRVLPLSAPEWDVIAQMQSMTVGVRRKIGKGTITFLGSPLGPALRAGDQQARQWLGEVLSIARA